MRSACVCSMGMGKIIGSPDSLATNENRLPAPDRHEWDKRSLGVLSSFSLFSFSFFFPSVSKFNVTCIGLACVVVLFIGRSIGYRRQVHACFFFFMLCVHFVVLLLFEVPDIFRQEHKLLYMSSSVHTPVHRILIDLPTTRRLIFKSFFCAIVSVRTSKAATKN